MKQKIKQPTYISYGMSKVDLKIFNTVIDFDTEFEMYMKQKYSISVHRTTRRSSGNVLTESRIIYDEKTGSSWCPDTGKVTKLGEIT